jgi:hypothetical protein
MNHRRIWYENEFDTCVGVYGIIYAIRDEGNFSAREPQKQNIVKLLQYKKAFTKDTRNDESRI